VALAALADGVEAQRSDAAVFRRIDLLRIAHAHLAVDDAAFVDELQVLMGRLEGPCEVVPSLLAVWAAVRETKGGGDA
jgi:hypothetical protein